MTYGRPVDDAGIVLGSAALMTSLAGIWLFRHAIGRAIHDVASGSS